MFRGWTDSPSWNGEHSLFLWFYAPHTAPTDWFAFDMMLTQIGWPGYA